MAYPGLFIAACALFLAADGLAQPAPDPVAAAHKDCRFTLERSAGPADDQDETWVLTCHRVEAPAPPTVSTVALRRVALPKVTVSQ
jgi:hypothetical protein